MVFSALKSSCPWFKSTSGRLFTNKINKLHYITHASRVNFNNTPNAHFLLCFKADFVVLNSVFAVLCG